MGVECLSVLSAATRAGTIEFAKVVADELANKKKGMT